MITNRPETIAMLADTFTQVIREWLTPAQLRDVDRANLTADAHTCATHDHCDANMAVLEAWERVQQHISLPDFDVDSDEHAAIFTAAWDKSKARGFRKAKLIPVIREANDADEDTGHATYYCSEQCRIAHHGGFERYTLGTAQAPLDVTCGRCGREIDPDPDEPEEGRADLFNDLLDALLLVVGDFDNGALVHSDGSALNDIENARMVCGKAMVIRDREDAAKRTAAVEDNAHDHGPKLLAALRDVLNNRPKAKIRAAMVVRQVEGRS